LICINSQEAIAPRRAEALTAAKFQADFRILSGKFDQHQRPVCPAHDTPFVSQMEVVMPIDSMLVSAAVVVMFATFAGVLAWGERQSRSAGQEPVKDPRRRRSF
jgi:hypothetical protein